MAQSVNILQNLKRISDPRGRRGRQYPLYSLLAILLLAAMRGERSLRGMWMYKGEIWGNRRRWECGGFFFFLAAKGSGGA